MPSEEQHSAKWYMVPNFADELKRQLGGRPRVASMSLKARAAIGLGGHGGANTTIVWTLNLYYTLQGFGDTNANPLPMETVLSFTTGTTVASNPPPELGDPKRLPNGRFQFVVSGQINQSYVVQASTNLTQWTSLATNVAFTGEIEFLDTNAPTIPHRFYRAVGH
jgi:hypothetical protein